MHESEVGKVSRVFVCASMQRFISPFLFRSARPITLARSHIRYYANMDAPGAAETDTQAGNVARTTGITPESLSHTLKEKLEAKHVDIEDMSGNHIVLRSIFDS